MERLLQNRFGSLGNVTAGPDGGLYISTANRSTSQAQPDDDRVLRIVPASN